MSAAAAVKIVALSDTHGRHEAVVVPAGDVLVHCGDFSMAGTDGEVGPFLDWFARQPHAHKVLVVGNHEVGIERDLAAFRARVPRGVTFLSDEAAVVAGLRFYGSPWTPIFFDWAFMLPRGEPLRAKWAAIPDDTDVLITHGPPYGHGDHVPPIPGLSAQARSVGCLELLHAVRRVQPRLHLFGHIHPGHGVSGSEEIPGTRFANAAICDDFYEATNPPLVLEVTPR